jgi:uncharacterized integral membrane protein
MLILPGSGMVALGALLGRNAQWKLLGSAFVLVAFGVGAMVGLGTVGGVGGRSEHSMWWLLTVLPYPVGWIMGLWGVVALVGSGWPRRLLCGAAVLAIIGLIALILLCTLHVAGRMPVAAFHLCVTVPHGLGLMLALVGGILWIVESFRTGSAEKRHGQTEVVA